MFDRCRRISRPATQVWPLRQQRGSAGCRCTDSVWSPFDGSGIEYEAAERRLSRTDWVLGGSETRHGHWLACALLSWSLLLLLSSSRPDRKSPCSVKLQYLMYEVSGQGNEGKIFSFLTVWIYFQMSGLHHQTKVYMRRKFGLHLCSPTSYRDTVLRSSTVQMCLTPCPSFQHIFISSSLQFLLTKTVSSGKCNVLDAPAASKAPARISSSGLATADPT